VKTATGWKGFWRNVMAPYWQLKAGTKYIFFAHTIFISPKNCFSLFPKKKIFSKPFSEDKKLFSGPTNENILAAFCTAISYRVCQSQKIPA
jgi:hypothetical protein